MKVIELPNEKIASARKNNDGIIFQHFLTHKGGVKERSILTRNAFSLVIQGTKTMHFAEKTVRIKNNEIHLLSAGTSVAAVHIADHTPFESILVYFDNEVLADFMTRHAHLIAKMKSKQIETQPYVEFPKDAYILCLIQSVQVMLKKNQTPSKPMKQLKLEELFVYLLETYPQQLLAFKPSFGTKDTAHTIRSVVETNKENNLTLDELAFLCNMSVSTFKRHFRKIYHHAPIEWLNQQRMTLAGKMLAHEKPSEIWHKLGFATHTGFTKSFKKHYGMAPSEYSKLTFPE